MELPKHGARIIDGMLHAGFVLRTVSERLEVFKRRTGGVVPQLAVIVVGNDPASKLYVKLKAKRAQEIGVKSVVHELHEGVQQDVLLDVIGMCNADDNVHGVMLQLPLPKHLDESVAIDAVDSAKDVDGFTAGNIGLLYTNRPRFIPCTTCGIIELLKSVFHSDLSGRKVAIIGRSTIVGKPTAMALLNMDCTVTILHSRSRRAWEETAQADVVISATGVPHLVTRDWVRPGACVIDVGVSRVDGKVIGDVDFDDVVGIAGHITPVPGGVGPMTVAYLLDNTLRAAYLKYGMMYE